MVLREIAASLWRNAAARPPAPPRQKAEKERVGHASRPLLAVAARGALARVEPRRRHSREREVEALRAQRDFLVTTQCHQRWRSPLAHRWLLARKARRRPLHPLRSHSHQPSLQARRLGRVAASAVAAAAATTVIHPHCHPPSEFETRPLGPLAAAVWAQAGSAPVSQMGPAARALVRVQVAAVAERARAASLVQADALRVAEALALRLGAARVRVREGAWSAPTAARASSGGYAARKASARAGRESSEHA